MASRLLARAAGARRLLHTASQSRVRAATVARNDDPMTAPREVMDYDVVIVGGGPAGLSAGIRLKQLAADAGKEINVCLVEKGAEVGSHILSGNVFQPIALDELLPNWKQLDAPVHTPVTTDEFYFLTEKSSYHVPHSLMPPQLNNDGNFIISLSQLTRWMATQAEAAGVEIFPGFSADEVLFRKDGSVAGIATKDMGIGKDGKPKDGFARGMELRARQTLFAEGCRGSCSEKLISKFNLREGRQVQTYGLGIKEVWQVPKENHQMGLAAHTYGYPLQSSVFDKTFGGSFMYHMGPDLVLIGLVVGLDYKNPWLNPYEEFQRWKSHPRIRKVLEGGTPIAYGARCLNEGGYHAIPRLSFPGGALIGCSAGFLNSVKIKGSHTAMKSGMVAAEAAFEALAGKATCGEGAPISEDEPAIELTQYEPNMAKSWVYDELKEVRNSHQSFHYGALPGILYTGAAALITKGREPWTLSSSVRDSEQTGKAADYPKIQYPKPDNVITFDLLTSLTRAGVNHEAQPSHLKIKPELADVPVHESYQVYGAPESRFCPARVYEYHMENDKPKLVINSQNCVHCKCCSIKTPKEYINWTVPEGGGGPAYEIM